LNAAALVRGEPVSAAPRTTAIGALAYYVSHADPRHYEPSNITFGIMPPLDRPPRGKMERKLALSKRALDDLARWMRDTTDGRDGLKTVPYTEPGAGETGVGHGLPPSRKASADRHSLGGGGQAVPRRLEAVPEP
jgi:hypothetical protein